MRRKLELTKVARLPAEALAKQVRHLDEEGSAVAPEAWLQLAGKGIKPAAIEIVVVTQIESGTWIGRVAKQELSFVVGRYRIKIDTTARKQEAAELIGAAQRDNVLIESQQAGVVTPQSLLGEIQRRLQGGGWLEGYPSIHMEEIAGSRILRRIANGWQNFRGSARRSRIAKMWMC
jgi:hypothetical protein